MDQTNHQNLSRFTKLLLSISVFSLLFSSPVFISFLPPWHFHLSTFLLRLATHAVNKNCIFLLCNGILVFLMQISGFIGTMTTRSSWHSTGDKDPPKETLHMMENKLLATDIDDGVLPDVVQEDLDLEKEGKTLNNNDNTHEDWMVDDNDDNKEEEQEHNIGFRTLEARNIAATSDPDGEEELDECGGEREDDTSEDYRYGVEIRYGNNVMTAEELDKKFDDFIRRMKEGIMIETQQQQQQLLVV
ncbi:hypothetical protein ACJRO7_023889 [Eucalyptus globulus]|uniref:DUF4408 domain-containing protein n=1 Tax=Eucalyptus globulus TaxID=34317 RepID=A0ABD3K3G4_EUCGL